MRLVNGVEAPWTYLDPSNDGTDWAFQYDGPPAGDVCQPSCASEDYLGADDYLTPQTGSTSTSMPLFTWNPISGAGGYFIVVATDQAMTHVIDYAWTEVPAYSPRTSSSQLAGLVPGLDHQLLLAGLPGQRHQRHRRQRRRRPG